MKYFHNLDPDQIREMEERDRQDLEEREYWRSVAELAAEDAAMEKYYERKRL